jgi:hypothetical protein
MKSALSNRGSFVQQEFDLIEFAEPLKRGRTPKSKTVGNANFSSILKKYDKKEPYCCILNSRLFFYVAGSLICKNLEIDLNCDIVLKIPDVINIDFESVLSVTLNNSIATFCFKNLSKIDLDVFTKESLILSSKNFQQLLEKSDIEYIKIKTFNNEILNKKLPKHFNVTTILQDSYYSCNNFSLICEYPKSNLELPEIEIIEPHVIAKLGLDWGEFHFFDCQTNQKSSNLILNSQKDLISVLLFSKIVENRFNNLLNSLKFENAKILPVDFFQKLKFAFSQSKSSHVNVIDGAILNFENGDFLGNLDFSNCKFHESVCSLEQDWQSYYICGNKIAFVNNMTLGVTHVGKVEARP